MNPIIESFPISSSGNCYITSGQTVAFTISGASNGTYQWYLNGVCVSVGSGYTLVDANNNDQVHVNFVSCTGISNTIRLVDYTDPPSVLNVGTLRYRKSGNNSYLEMCMQTGAISYSWVLIKQNSW